MNAINNRKVKVKTINKSPEDRRQESRITILDLLSGYISTSGEKAKKVELKDVSKGGVAFSVKKEKECVPVGELVKLDLYFANTDNFFQCELKVLEVFKDDKKQFRHRTQITDSSENKEALSALFDFLAAVEMGGGST